MDQASSFNIVKNLAYRTGPQKNFLRRMLLSLIFNSRTCAAMSGEAIGADDIVMDSSFEYKFISGNL
ncbi:hypothetical protein LPB67_10560 [Undibacterium sp. Jales W-56]|uniref:hypothetical protein n=1 Tax=Undibacterium sp. Jales W-56 TaxID=2897325 RepID=UPI0021D0B7A2|nr:hypothetical protein [Undibacterium sp. Jales W-56]MCU6434211.1 hypothetical protein [Undibacterium sp. Jales W-56]